MFFKTIAGVTGLSVLGTNAAAEQPETQGVTTEDELLTAIENASSGDVVWIDPNATIDLTGHEKIPVDNFSIASGNGQITPGAHIRCTDYPKALFETTGQAKFVGLRIEGPNKDNFPWPGYNAGKISAGIGHGGESGPLSMSRCEIWGWTHAGVRVGDLNVRGQANIVDCDIHHCQMEGLGYGVSLYDKAQATIRRCTFNWTRHAIAGKGGSACSYLAEQNFHGPQAQSHAFDMHQPGGENMTVHENTFRFDHNNAAKMRGIPEDEWQLTRNEFGQQSPPTPPGDGDSAYQQIYYGSNEPFVKLFAQDNLYNTTSEQTGAPADVISRYQELHDTSDSNQDSGPETDQDDQNTASSTGSPPGPREPRRTSQNDKKPRKKRPGK